MMGEEADFKEVFAVSEKGEKQSLIHTLARGAGEELLSRKKKRLR